MTITTMFRTGITAVASVFVLGLAAQSDCADYHKFNCARSGDPRFSINGQSKSASVQVGVPTELNIIVYKGQDYRISLCHDERILGDQLSIRLVEKVREPKEVIEQITEKQAVLDPQGNPTGVEKDVVRSEKKTVYEDQRIVLWDNAEHDMSNEVEFTATTSKRVVVEVMAAGVVEGKAKKDSDIGCAGILIEHMATPNVGF